MGSDKTPDEMMGLKEAMKQYVMEADRLEKKVKRQAKRQRQKMRKRGIKLFQDYCR